MQSNWSSSDPRLLRRMVNYWRFKNQYWRFWRLPEICDRVDLDMAVATRAAQNTSYFVSNVAAHTLDNLFNLEGSGGPMLKMILWCNEEQCGAVVSAVVQWIFELWILGGLWSLWLSKTIISLAAHQRLRLQSSLHLQKLEEQSKNVHQHLPSFSLGSSSFCPWHYITNPRFRTFLCSNQRLTSRINPTADPSFDKKQVAWKNIWFNKHNLYHFLILVCSFYLYQFLYRQVNAWN